MGAVISKLKTHFNFAKFMLVSTVKVSAYGLISLPLWPMVWIGSAYTGRPPNMVYLSQVYRYLKYAWTVNPPAPGFKPYSRIALSMMYLEKALFSPIVGVAWLLDELIYGRALDKITLQNPFFLISGARSGSTQMSRYLDDDPTLIAPNKLMCDYPYLWLWKLASATIGQVLTLDQIREMMKKTKPKSFLERREFDPFGVDSFDVCFVGCHLNASSRQLGPDVAKLERLFWDCAPHNRQLLEDDFVRLVDRLGRKTYLFNRGVDPSSTRFFLKGHFLQAASALDEKYPEANFLTILRDPLFKLRSAVNLMPFISINSHPVLGPVPIAWWTEVLLSNHICYNNSEMEWFSDNSKGNRSKVRFEDYVKDLEGTMLKVYKECMGRDSLPEHVPTEHPPRNRKNYTVNKSLEELGVDEEAIKQQLAAYITWISE